MLTKSIGHLLLGFTLNIKDDSQNTRLSRGLWTDSVKVSTQRQGQLIRDMGRGKGENV
jgi:hypothetical protein